MLFLTKVSRGPSIWVLGIGGGVGIPSVVDRVRSASLSVPFTSKMQRAPIINDLHCDLLRVGSRNNSKKRRLLHRRIFRIVGQSGLRSGRRPCDWNDEVACQVHYSNLIKE